MQFNETYKHSCYWCCNNFKFEQGGVEKRTGLSDLNFMPIDNFNFCPNCGRKISRGIE